MRWGLALMLSLALTSAANAQPLERPLSLHLSWAIGERAPIITLDYDLGSDEQRSSLKVDSRTVADIVILKGQVDISDARNAADAEVKQVLAAVRTANLWQISDDAAPKPEDEGSVTFCRSSFEIRAQAYDRRKWIARDCLDPRKDATLIVLARTLIGLAQKHFPELTAHTAWRATLQ